MQCYQASVNSQLAAHHLRSLRRAWAGANLCRERLDAAADGAPVLTHASGVAVRDMRSQAGHDVDYYAWECVRIIKLAETAIKAGLRGGADVNEALTELRVQAPLLKDFRDSITHPESNRGADDIVYFGEAVRLPPGGHVEYVVDPRHETHEALDRLFAATEAALLTLGQARGPALPKARARRH